MVLPNAPALMNLFLATLINLFPINLFLSDMLEECPFLRLTLPWGPLSSLQLPQRSKSDDGPIMWVRPGEQLIPTAEIGLTPNKRM